MHENKQFRRFKCEDQVKMVLSGHVQIKASGMKKIQCHEFASVISCRILGSVSLEKILEGARRACCYCCALESVRSVSLLPTPPPLSLPRVCVCGCGCAVSVMLPSLSVYSIYNESDHMTACIVTNTALNSKVYSRLKEASILIFQ